jgi:succinate dehydrogenase/fumarate reductase cytochrome b subunit
VNEARNWTWHIITAILILVFLGLHMFVMHLDDLVGWFVAGGTAISWTSVLARSKSTFFAITYVVLLAAALYHGLYGLRTILLELSIGPRGQRFLTVLFWIGGICLFGIGTLGTIAAYALEAAG